MKVTAKMKVHVSNAAEAASKSHGKNLSGLSFEDQKEYVEKWAPKHRNVAEHMVYSLDIQGITRAAGELLGATKHGFTMTEMSQRYRKVRDFAWDHEYNEMAASAYEQLMKDFKWKKEDARYVLPDTAATEMYVTSNRVALFEIIRKLMYVNKYDMQELAERLKDILLEDIDSDAHLLRPMVVPFDKFKHEPTVQVDDCCGYPIVTITDRMSVAAYQQLKRHRVAIETQFGKRDSDFYEIGLPRKGRVLYRDTMSKCRTVTKNGDMRWFLWQMPINQLPGFFQLRCDSHAQREIRDWANEIKDIIHGR